MSLPPPDDDEDVAAGGDDTPSLPVPPAAVHRVPVEPGTEPVRLDRHLAVVLPHLSRARIHALMVMGHVTVDGRAPKPAHKVRPGEVITVEEPAARGVELEPQDLPLDILVEDSDFLAVNKAPGMVVHPAAGNPDRTLVNALLFHVKDLKPVGGELRPGIVHRLDKDTSGVMVVAKGDAALQALQQQFRDRTTVKRYLALCRGEMKVDLGTWDTPFGRHPTQRMRYTSRGGDRRAVTDFLVVARAGGVTLLEVTLHTGRTHQVRVHAAEHGHPLLGDELYGGKNPGLLPGGTEPSVPRQMLHAAFLRLVHPGARKKTVRISAPLHEDMLRVAQDVGLREVMERWWKDKLARD